MVKKADFQSWVLEALRSAGGRSTVVGVCRHIWSAHETELRGAGDLFYTWQYDVRWAAHQLRRRGAIRPVSQSPRGVWELAQ
jgi:hypothetical protein